jgi:undecaprenyl-diphosphatase
MEIWKAIILGIVEGITEFLPVSSTGHLTISEKLLGLQVDSKAVTAYTAMIQVGAMIAAIIYFWKDIVRILVALWKGLRRAEDRQTADWRLAAAVTVGSMPVVVVALAFKGLIEGPLRSLWWVAGALIAWSVVMVFAERAATQRRGEGDITIKDGLIIGLAQCVSLIPGVSRSGATISAGLLRDLDRVTSTRMAFFLGIPALTAAGIFEAIVHRDDVTTEVGWGASIVGLVVSFAVAYASIAWLLRFVRGNSMLTFVWYRVIAGAVLMLALSVGWISAT